MDSRDFLKGALASTVIAIAATGPSMAAENVSTETRAKVAALQASDPAFKLKTFHRKCLDGSVIDVNCEKGLTGYIENYITEKEVNARETQVNARETQVNARETQVNARETQVNAERVQQKNIDDIILHLDISLALIQLANYVAYNEPIPNNGSTLKIALTSDKTPEEIKVFIQSLKGKKDTRVGIEYNNEGKKLLGYLKLHLNIAIQKMGTLTIKNKSYDNLEKQIALMKQTYSVIDQTFTKKMS